MAKSEYPAMLCTVENGKIVPATSYDAERLASYRNGTKIKIQVTETKDRPRLKAWWAVLNLCISQCKTPWKTAAQASEAIKMSIGITNMSKSAGGERILETPKSLTELSDVELDDAFEMMVALMSKLTGVNVAELKKEGGSHEHEPGVDYDRETGEVSDENEGEQEQGETESQAPQDDAAIKLKAQLTECGRKFLVLASDFELDEKQRLAVLGQKKDDWKKVVPAEALGTLANIYIDTQMVIKKTKTAKVAALEWAAVIGCEPEELWRS